MAKDIKDTDQALERLGISTPEAPGGETVQTEEPEQKATEEPKLDASKVGQAVKIEEVVSSTQNKDGTIKEEETQRRSWQAEADIEKGKNEKLNQKILDMQEQNRQLLNVITPLQKKYQQPETVETKTPKVDFISDGYFDPDKFVEYEKNRDAQMQENLEKRIISNMDKTREEKATQEQLLKVAEEFPEYVNTMTGEVDIKRVHSDLLKYTSRKTIVDLLRDSKGKTVNPDVLSESLAAINKNADKPQSVVASMEADSEQKPVPEEIKSLVKTYGSVEVPPGFDGIE